MQEITIEQMFSMTKHPNLLYTSDKEAQDKN